MNTPPRALILDLGNVLVFHDDALLFRRLGARAGLPTAEVERRLAGEGWTAANRGLVGADGLRRDVSRALGVELSPEEFFELWNCHFTLHGEMLPRLERLMGRVKLALLSNTNVVHAAYLRPRLPMLERFDQVLLSCEVGLVKPEPAFFHEALRRLGCAPREAAFFDDLPEFVAAASALGLRGHLFTTTAAFDEQLRLLGL
ncbi:MAG TPA: HAD family phosphatase [Myxococcaceae bacterium]|nr:HAD family phosphatase [Myxococcaceae bacterium]